MDNLNSNDPLNAEENESEQEPTNIPVDSPLIASEHVTVHVPFDKHPKKQLAADLIAAGLPQKKVADEVGVSDRVIRKWAKEDPDFLPAVEAIRERLLDSARGQIYSFMPKAIFRAGELLDSKQPATVLKAAKEIRDFYSTVVKDPAISQTNIQINSQVNVGNNPPPPEATILSDIPTFVEKDLGIPLSTIYPRILWLLELLERPDIHQVYVQAGKGSGKSILAALFLCRMLQKVMSLQRIPEFFGLMPGSMVGLLNLSVTHTQAQLAVFREFSMRVEHSPWFKKYAPPTLGSTLLTFPRGVKALCGSSSSKGAEGLNWLCAAVDEVCHLTEGDNEERINAQDLVDPVRATMVNRFPKHHKLLVMSWPAHQKDYLHREIAQAMKAGIKEDLTAEFKKVPLTRGTMDEEAIRQQEILEPPFAEYAPSVVVTKKGDLIVIAPTWQLKSDTDLQLMREEAAIRDMQFSCMFGARPKRAGTNPFVRNLDMVRSSANKNRQHPIDKDGRFVESFKGNDEYVYFGHYDVGVKKDAAGLAVAHYDAGRVVYDLLLEIKPEDQEGGEVRIQSIRQWFYDMETRGFTFRRITQDGFEGLTGKQDMEAHGVESDIFSVDRSRKAYDTWLEALYGNKLDYYDYEPIYECVASLVDLGRKIDHTVDGKKDLTDAMAAVAYAVLEFAGFEDGSNMGSIL